MHVFCGAVLLLFYQDKIDATLNFQEIRLETELHRACYK